MESDVANLIKLNAQPSSSIRIIKASINNRSLLKSAIEYLSWIYKDRGVIAALTSVELKRSIVQTKLSYLWWLLDPFLNFLCYLFLVMVLNRGGHVGVPYPLFILSAIIPWNFTVKSLTNSTRVWERYTKLIGQIRFPYIHILISTLLHEAVLYLSSFIILFIVAFCYGYPPSTTWLFIPFIIMLHTLLVFAFMMFASLIRFSFIDFQKLTPYVLRIWFFLSPAVWSIDMIPNRFKAFVYFNPMSTLFESYRNSLFYHKPMNWHHIDLLAIATVILLLISFIMFVNKEPYINRCLNV